MAGRPDLDDLLDGLNPAQREAVTHDEGPLLVIAGAGSGKTRVLTHRIAHLIEDRHVSPFGILAITFTNKAAQEMRHRVGGLIGPVAEKMWVSTFHSACVRILRRDAQLLGYPITLAEDMPALATGSLSMAFGDFRSGYQIVDRLGVRVLRDPYTEKPYVKFYTTRRVGGAVVNFEAIKFVRFAA